ncbi:hypothetical protein SUGI_0401820 [Cryptomeria japonica]|nr:hypothetical protein SUGI_0401820 [Cryptomeria japonica]
MGRGRGKGKKLTAVSKHEEPGSGGEDSIPPSAYRRRGRPLVQKGAKDEVDADEEDIENMIDEEEEDVKPAKEIKATENGKKRKRHICNGRTHKAKCLGKEWKQAQKQAQASSRSWRRMSWRKTHPHVSHLFGTTFDPWQEGVVISSFYFVT